jgi:uncharacterized coiled-coil DUF342 family protein
LTKRQKTQTIEELTQQLHVLKQQRDTLEGEVSDYVKKRRKFNEQVKKMRAEIQDLRRKRDKLNEKVKDLKLERNAMTEEIHQRIEERKKLNQESQILANKRPVRSRQSLQNEFETVEWKIQTSSLTLPEERELIERVRNLEAQLIIYRRIEQATQRTKGLMNEIGTLKGESELRHKKLTEAALRSQEMHKSMLGKIEDAKEIKLKAGDLHNQFLEAKEKKTRLQESITEIRNKIKQLKNKIKKKELETRKRDEQALRETLEKKARSKLRSGKKLSWNEFQLLAEENEETQGST